MKKSILLFTFLTCFFSFSQTKFIEVEVRDSIQLKVTNFEYQIDIIQTDNELYGNENNIAEKRKEIRENTKKRKKEIEKFLQQKNYNYRAPYNNYLINNNPLFENKSFIITLKDTTELKKVQKDFERFDYINISLRETFFEDQEKSNERLFKKLIEKSTKKARMIAKLSNLKLGEIIEFKEVKEIDNFSFSIMDLYINKNNRNSSSITYMNGTKAIVVKFSAN